MASGVAHELNNPLTSVIGLSQLLIGEDLPESLKEDLRGIRSEAQRAAAVVKGLLTFAREHAPHKQPVQVNDVLQDVLKLRAYEQHINNIQVHTRLDPALPLVTADAFQLQQVFLNIVLNSEQAMGETNRHSKLSVVSAREGEGIRVSISDNGPGIAPENLARIFNPFFTTKEVGKGTGLGLSICYGIVKNHGGNISARSEAGRGATFIVDLPLNSGEEIKNDTERIVASGAGGRG
jgi:signal transduction histidine kinase